MKFKDFDRQRWKCLTLLPLAFIDRFKPRCLPLYVHFLFSPCFSLHLISLTNLFLFRSTRALVSLAHQSCSTITEDQMGSFCTRARFQIRDHIETCIAVILSFLSRRENMSAKRQFHTSMCHPMRRKGAERTAKPQMAFRKPATDATLSSNAITLLRYNVIFIDYGRLWYEESSRGGCSNIFLHLTTDLNWGCLQHSGLYPTTE